MLSNGGNAANRTLAALRAADVRLASVASRLVISNVALCAKTMPATGAIVQALDQYPVALRPAASSELGFAAPVAIEAVVTGSAADRAGLRAGDGILAINDLELPRNLNAKTATSATRDSVERAITALPPLAPIRFRLIRAGAEFGATVSPEAACRTRFEVVPGGGLTAHSDGETIQIGSGFVQRYNDAALAVAFAHELAHTILGHRASLAAAGDDNHRLARLAEREADRLSVHLLVNAGYNPAIAPQFWREHGGAIGFLGLGDSKHDSPKARIALLEAEIATLPRR